MAERKYIILANTETGREYAVIFDRDLAHKAVAEGIMSGMRRTEWGPRMFLEPVAAGFVGDGARGSDSLGIGPRPQDESILSGSDWLRNIPLVVSAADGPSRRPEPTKPKRSMLDRARGAKSR